MVFPTKEALEQVGGSRGLKLTKKVKPRQKTLLLNGKAGRQAGKFYIQDHTAAVK